MNIHVENSRYSPQLMDPEDLEQLFVGREGLVTEVMDGLAASILGAEKHFFLLIGPRGSGKTHFAHLLAHRLRQSSSLAGKFRLAHFREEVWEIDSYLEFLLQIHHALGMEKGGEIFLAKETAIRQNYNPKQPEESIHAAEKNLIHAGQEKPVLLICENLADLMVSLGDAGQWKWRGFMQENPFMAVLATSPALSEQIRRKENAFYGFFNIDHLGPLTGADEVVDLLRRRAERAGTAKGDGLALALASPMGRARARVIHHLAGGNHRACVTLLPFLDQESLDELAGPFAKMVDDLTPYYQSRIKDLSPGQRKITSFLARMRTPTTVGKVASACLMTPQTAAKEIERLVGYGVLLRHKQGKNTRCELAEPLMRLCFEVKENRTEHLQLFVDLLRGWFSGYVDAQESLNKACPALDSPHRDLLAGQLLAAQGDIAALSTILAGLNTNNQLDPEQLAGALTEILRVVARQWSPALLDTYLNLFLRTLGAWTKRKIMGQVVSQLTTVFLEEFQHDAKAWHEVLPALEKTVGHLKQCEIPLRLLRAVVNRLYEGNDGPLLELALEERQLLEALIKEKERHQN